MTPILEEDRRSGAAPQGFGARRPANVKAPVPPAPNQAPATPAGFTPTASPGVFRNGNAFADLPGAQSQAATAPPQGSAFGAAPGSPAAQPAAPGGEMPNPGQTSPNPGTMPAAAPDGAPTAPGNSTGFGARRPTAVQGASSVENQAGGFGANQQALARLQAGNAASQPASGAPTQQMAMPSIKTSANDWETRNNLRSLRVSANSLTNEPRWGGMGARSPDVQAYMAAVETDNAARQGKNPMAQEMLQQLGATRRTEIQDTGATQRAGMQEQGANTRAGMTNEVQRGELAVKQGEFGVKSRSARLLEEAQQSFVNARSLEERAQAAQTIRVLSGKDEQPTAPAGYRWAAGGNLQPIAGGPADRSRDPKLTEDQGKSAGYAVRMENSLNLLGEINKTNPGATRPGAGTALLNTLPESVANMVRPEDRQRVEAAQLDALDAALTLNTGAAYTREQLQGMSRSYFAQPGDSDKTVQEKQARLASLIETARLRAGPQGNQMADAALERGRQNAQQPQQQVAQPQAGEVRRGYRFRGGNPADRANWEAVQ